MARKILLADDSVTAQNMGRKILADAGYDVITVNNGSAALKRIAEIKPDLIVLDVYMPGYSGLEVCQRLKESADTAHIPVLLTVGKLEPFKPEEARRVRADAHIVKPFEASELLTAISKLEDRMVPQAADSSRFSASTAGVERFGGETGAKKSSARVPETDTGWKNRIRFPSKKKKEDEPDAEDLAAAELATLADSRKGKKAGNGVFAKTVAAKEPAIVPDIPRDITPEELDALSAVAEKLDSSAVPEDAAPVAVKKFQRRSTDRSADVSAATTASVPAAAGPTAVEENRAVAELEIKQVDAPIIEVQANAQVEAVRAIQSVEPVVEQQKEQQKVPQKEREKDQQKAEQQLEVVQHPAGEVAIADAAKVAPLVEASPSLVESDQPEAVAASAAADEQVSEATTETLSASSVASQAADGLSADGPAADGPAPSDAELAAALQLLTPANGDSMPSNGNHSQEHSSSIDRVAAEGSRWMAEAVTLTPAESAISLESEMFGVPAVLPKAVVANIAEPEQPPAVLNSDADRNSGFSGIAAAVETRLAEAGMGVDARAWTIERERSAENAAAEAAAALEASAELLSAASAANPLMDQIGANVDQKIDEHFGAEYSQHRAEPSQESSSREESSATFADAMNRDGQNHYEIDSAAGQNRENQAPVVSANNPTSAENTNTVEAEGQDSMSKDGKIKSGTSNWQEIKTASNATAENEVETAKQNAVEDFQKAMAAAASEGSNSSTDANTIASIVDSVMADLRPRIVEEIARKLAKK